MDRAQTVVSGVAISGAILFLGVVSTRAPLRNGRDYAVPESMIENGIADERGYYYPDTGLLRILNGQDLRNIGLGGISMRTDGSRVVVTGHAGITCYYTGPGVHFVDLFGLGDPLLAHLPIDDPRSWRIGHFERRLPDGYVETLESGTNQIRDPDIARLYDKISLFLGRIEDMDSTLRGSGDELVIETHQDWPDPGLREMQKRRQMNRVVTTQRKLRRILFGRIHDFGNGRHDYHVSPLFPKLPMDLGEPGSYEAPAFVRPLKRPNDLDLTDRGTRRHIRRVLQDLPHVFGMILGNPQLHECGRIRVDKHSPPLATVLDDHFRDTRAFAMKRHGLGDPAQSFATPRNTR